MFYRAGRMMMFCKTVIKKEKREGEKILDLDGATFCWNIFKKILSDAFQNQKKRYFAIVK